jgi:hypothetical protein
VAALLGLPAAGVVVTRVSDAASGAVLFAAPGFRRRRLVGARGAGAGAGAGGRDAARGLQGGGAVVAIRAETGAANSGNAVGAAASSAQATLLGSYLSGAVPLPAAAAAQLNGSVWGLVAAAAGVPPASLSAAVVAGSVVTEPSFAPFVAPTPSTTPTPSATPTPIVTGLLATDTTREDPAKLSGFQIAGFVAAGIGALLLAATSLLCFHFGLHELCCKARAAPAGGVGVAASNEFRKVKGRGPLVIGGRRDGTKVDRGDFGSVNPLRAGPRPSIAPSIRDSQQR